MSVSQAWFNLAEAVKYSGRSRRTLERAIDRGELEAFRRDRRVMVRRVAIDEWMMAEPARASASDELVRVRQSLPRSRRPATPGGLRELLEAGDDDEHPSAEAV